MEITYQFAIPYTGVDTDYQVNDWFLNIGCDHWFAEYRTLPPDNWPKHLGANPPRHMYKREMIVGMLDEDIALQFKLAFSATQLFKPYL